MPSVGDRDRHGRLGAAGRRRCRRRLLDYRRPRRRLKLPPEEAPQSTSRRPSEEEARCARCSRSCARAPAATSRTTSARPSLRRIARRMQVNGVADAARLPGLPAHAHRRGRRAAAGHADQRDQLLPRRRRLRRRSKPSFRSCSTARRRTTRCASGCRRAPPARRPTRSPFCCANTRAGLQSPRGIQIFATDLDEDVDPRRPRGAVSGIDRGRRVGRPAEALLHEGAPRLPRAPRSSRVGAVRAARRAEDSPFSRLDLISCRNLLIYLNRDAQQKLFDIFHFALRPEGLLFLGVSETVDDDNGAVSHRSTRRIASTGSGPRRGPGCRCRSAPARWRACSTQHGRSPDGARRRRRRGSDVQRREVDRARVAAAARRFLERDARQADRARGAAFGARQRRARDAAPVRERRALPAVCRRRADEQPACARCTRCCASNCARRCTAPRSRARRRSSTQVPIELDGGASSVDLHVSPGRGPRARRLPGRLRTRAGAAPATDAGAATPDTDSHRAPARTRTRAAEGAPARHRAAVRRLDRGAESEQRRTAGDERRAALGHRGTGDQPRGTAVDQRRADHRQRRAEDARSTTWRTPTATCTT